MSFIEKFNLLVTEIAAIANAPDAAQPIQARAFNALSAKIRQMSFFWQTSRSIRRPVTGGQ